MLPFCGEVIHIASYLEPIRLCPDLNKSVKAQGRAIGSFYEKPRVHVNEIRRNFRELKWNFFDVILREPALRLSAGGFACD